MMYWGTKKVLNYLTEIYPVNSTLKLYIQGCSDSHRSSYEEKRNHLKLGILAPNEYIGRCLCILLLMIVDKHDDYLNSWLLDLMYCYDEKPQSAIQEIIDNLTGEQICDFIVGDEVLSKINKVSTISFNDEDYIDNWSGLGEIFDEFELTNGENTLVKSELIYETIVKPVKKIKTWTLDDIRKWFDGKK